ncbi:MAG: hypothetical protein CJBNEKGG_02338 [Prosthecobacter sp.]|nr:hypothetical protein [Prosthecobacter sp.]
MASFIFSPGTLLLAAMAQWACTAWVTAQTVALEPLMGLDATPSKGSSTLLWHSDGCFYGTSSTGGTWDKGVVFRMDSTGRMRWLSFSGYDDGNRPEAPLPAEAPSSSLLAGAGGWLWGTARTGGPSSLNGVIFKTRPETWETQIVVAFTGASGANPGKAPSGRLCKTGDRWLWGTTREGGSSELGSLFRLDELTGACREMLTFTGTDGAFPGAQPLGELYADATGNLWGVTRSGGSYDGGVVFKYRISTGTYTVIGHLSGNHSGIKGRFPCGGLTPDGNGYLWGLASQSGSGSAGTVFRVHMATGTSQTMHEFSGSAIPSSPGASPVGSLIDNGNGFLLGAAQAGGVGARGTLFKIQKSTGAVSVLFQFGSLTGAVADLRAPVTGLTQDSAGDAWGVGQRSYAGGKAFVYKVKSDGSSFTWVADVGQPEEPLRGQTPGPLVPEGSGDWLWGTTEAGGLYGHGTLYRWNRATRAMEVKVHFTGVGGASPGSTPRGKLCMSGSGEIWGSTSLGGTDNLGSVFKFVPDEAGGGVFSSVLSFTASLGATPHGSLHLDASGWLWGSTEGSVGATYGSIFKLNTGTGEHVIVHTFTDRNLGATPAGGLVSIGNGILAGLTRSGGSTGAGQLLNYGTIYQIDTATGQHTMRLAFTGYDGDAQGSAPLGELLALDVGGEMTLWGCHETRFFRFNPATQELLNLWPASLPMTGGFPRRAVFSAFSDGTQIQCLGLEQTQDPVSLQTMVRQVVYKLDSPAGPAPGLTPRVTLEEDLGILPARNDLVLFYSRPGELLGARRTGQMESPGSGMPGGLLMKVHLPVTPAAGFAPALATRPVRSGGSEVSGIQAVLSGVVTSNVQASTQAAMLIGTSSTTRSPVGTRLILPAGAQGKGVSSTRTLAPNTCYFYRTAAYSPSPSFLSVKASGLRCLLTGSAPLASGPEIAVEAASGMPVDESTGIDFGQVQIGKPGTQTVTLRNLGDAALGGISVSIDNDADNAFTLTLPPDRTSLSGTDSTTGMLLTFHPGIEGDYFAELVVNSNDPDEPSLRIPLFGNARGIPALKVFNSQGTEIPAGGVLDLGPAEIEIGAPVSKTIRLRNSGSGTLDARRVEMTGDVNGAFSSELTGSGSLFLAPGEEWETTLWFQPFSLGTQTARLIIAESGTSAPLLDLALQGTGVAIPRLTVYRFNEEMMSDEDLINGVSRLTFPKTALGSTSTVSIHLQSNGSATLAGLSLVIPEGAPFRLAGTLPTTLPQYEELQVDLVFQPTIPGDYDLPVSLRSNDPDDDPFVFYLSGKSTGPIPPRIAAQPQSQWVQPGQEARIPSEVRGSRPMIWEWRAAGKPVPGVTGDELVIPAAQASHATGYQFTAWNQIGTPVVSETAWLGLVTQGPDHLSVKAGKTLEIRCITQVPKAAGVSVKHRWMRGGQPLSDSTLPSGAVISGAQKDILKITGMTSAEAGVFTCQVTLDTPGNDPVSTQGDTLVTLAAGLPVMAAPALADSIPLGRPVDVQLSATHHPTSFQATGLPAGLSLNPRTGRLYGRPSAPSRLTPGSGKPVPTKILFRATNAFGTGPALEFSLAVTDPFAGLAGSYRSTLPHHEYTNNLMGGLITVSLSRTGVASGTLLIGGQRLPFTIPLFYDDEEGSAHAEEVKVPRKPAELGTLSLDLKIKADMANLTLRDRQWPALTASLPPIDAFFSHHRDEDKDEDIIGVVPGSTSGMTYDSEGSLFLADPDNHLIHMQIYQDESLFTRSTILGEPGISGSTDGTTPLFNRPEALVIDRRGFLQIADTGNASIRTARQSGEVTTLAGWSGQPGHADGTGSAARFRAPCGICTDPNGNLYVTDRASHVIRRITPDGVVTTLAGKPDTAGHRDGSGGSALFNSPNAITYEPVTGVLLVADTQNHVIRRVTPAGAVSTWIGCPGVPGFAPGQKGFARLTRPTSISTDSQGQVYFLAGSLWKVNRAGFAMPIAPQFAPSLDNPEMAVGNFAVLPGATGLIFSIASADLIQITEFTSAYTDEHSYMQAQEFLDRIPVSPEFLTDYVGTSTLAFSGLNMETGEPDMGFGHGYASATTSRSGAVTLAGKLPDGTTITLGGILGRHPTPEAPMHIMLLNNNASFQMSFAPDMTSSRPTRWRKLPQPSKGAASVHPAGASLDFSTFSSRYSAAGGLHAFLSLGDSPAPMTFNARGGAFTASSQVIELVAPNTFTIPGLGDLNPVDLQLSFNKGTGIFTGSFKADVGSTVRTSFSGAFVNDPNMGMTGGFGFFHYPESQAASAPVISGQIQIDPF